MIHVLTVDGSVARLYEVTGARPPLKEIVDFGNSVARLYERDLVSSPPGRAANRAAGVHQAFEPLVSAKRHATQQWLRGMGQLLATLIDKRSGGLILVASPRLLADLRQLLPSQVKKRIVSEYGRNLSGLPRRELAERLAATITAAQRRIAQPQVLQAVARARRLRNSASVT